MLGLCDTLPCLKSCSPSIVYQDIRLEEERDVSIAAAKENQKKEDAKRREERRVAAMAADIERMQGKEADGKRRCKEEDMVSFARTMRCAVLS